MGADKAVHLLDDALAGSDALATSCADRQGAGQTGFDLVICGAESTDARTGVLPAMLAERLGVPQLTLAGKVDIDGSAVTVRRVSDDGYDVVTGSLPAVVSAWWRRSTSRGTRRSRGSWRRRRSRCGSCRWPSGRRPRRGGAGDAATAVADFAARPPRAAGVVVKDEGDGGAKVAGFLAERKFI